MSRVLGLTHERATESHCRRERASKFATGVISGLPTTKNAIDDAAKRGWELFNTRGGCNKCHALTEDKRALTSFTDNDFHNIGIGIIRHNVVALAGQAEQLVSPKTTPAQATRPLILTLAY
jgi:cytochrome c peroxidase